MLATSLRPASAQVRSLPMHGVQTSALFGVEPLSHSLV